MKNYKIFKTALFIILGITIFFLKDVYIEHLRLFIGGLIVLYGIDGFVMWVFEKERDGEIRYLCKALVELILGTCTIIFFKELSTVCVIWAVWAILRESEEIAECYELFKEKLPCLFNFAESIVAIVFSIMLIIEPGEHHAKIHMYLLIVELFSAVLFPQARFIYIKYIKKEKAKEDK